MEKIVEIFPAYDKRDPNPSKNYGIHGCELRMILKGDKGAVQFLLFTNWYLPHVTEELISKHYGSPRDVKLFFLPFPADLGYHSPVPRYDEQTPLDDCPYLDGKPCYYDGSGLQAEKMYEVLLKTGSDGVWKELEQYYDKLFGEE